MLPYIEQGALHEELNPIKGTTCPLLDSGDRRVPLLTKGIPTFMCPSDPELTGNRPLTPPAEQTGGLYGKLNYPMAKTIACARSFNPPEDRARFGVVVRFNDVLDGTSNSFLLGERVASFTSTFQHIGGIWAAQKGSNNAYTFDCEPVNVSLSINPAVLNQNTQACCNSANDTQNGRGSANSMHPNGLQFSFCDGSVKFISENISCERISGTTQTNHTLRNPVSVFRRLYYRDDGQPLGAY